MQDSIDVKKLILAAQKGDKEAFDALYKLYLTPVYRYIYLRVHSKQLAEDITQTVFIKVYESLPSFKLSAHSPLAYCFTVARNTVIDHFRKKQLVLQEGNEEILINLPDERSSPQREMHKLEAASEIESMMAALTSDQREVIILKYINGLSNHEIAKLTGKTEEAIRQLQSRGLKNLQKLIKDSLGP